MRKLIVITGQTATGKTRLALELAQKYNGELINADSRQVYKNLDIVTGKDVAELAGQKVWLLDIVDPKDYFSSFDFKEAAKIAIEDIYRRGKTPVIVGGTYLYIQHLMYGFETETILPDWKLRTSLADKSVTELQKMLKHITLQSFERLNQSDRANPQRLMRKIEITLHLKKSKTPSDAKKSHLRGVIFSSKNIEMIGLRYKEKDTLTIAIKRRVRERMKMGALEETKKILATGYSKSDPGLRTIGYRQLIEHLEGKKTRQEAIDEWVLREVQYAKRQYTFMKKDKNIRWIEI